MVAVMSIAWTLTLCGIALALVALGFIRGRFL